MTDPEQILQSAVGRTVTVETRNGKRFRGILLRADAHMNVTLDKTEEVPDSGPSHARGLMVVRGDSMLWIVA